MERVKELELLVVKLQLENEELILHLSKYTASQRFKTYYEKNKEKISEKSKERYQAKKMKCV